MGHMGAWPYVGHTGLSYPWATYVMVAIGAIHADNRRGFGNGFGPIRRFDTESNVICRFLSDAKGKWDF